FFIIRRHTGKRGDSQRFDCWLSPAAEKRRAQQEMPLEAPEVTTSDLEQKLRDSLAVVNARKAQAAPAPQPRPSMAATGTHGPIAAPAPAVRQMPTKRQFGDAFEQFLVDAAIAVNRAEVRLAEQGITVQFGPDASKSMATTMFIEAAKRGFVDWNGGAQ